MVRGHWGTLTPQIIFRSGAVGVLDVILRRRTGGVAHAWISGAGQEVRR